MKAEEKVFFSLEQKEFRKPGTFKKLFRGPFAASALSLISFIRLHTHTTHTAAIPALLSLLIPPGRRRSRPSRRPSQSIAIALLHKFPTKLTSCFGGRIWEH